METASYFPPSQAWLQTVSKKKRGGPAPEQSCYPDIDELKENSLAESDSHSLFFSPFSLPLPALPLSLFLFNGVSISLSLCKTKFKLISYIYFYFCENTAKQKN